MFQNQIFYFSCLDVDVIPVDQSENQSVKYLAWDVSVDISICLF